MGRRRRSTGSESSNSVADCLLSLYDLGGFLSVHSSTTADDGRSADGPTQRLVRSLRQLAALLETVGSSDSWTDVTLAPLLVETEHLLRELRDELLPAALTERQADVDQVLRLRRDLESAGASSSHFAHKHGENLSHWSQILLGFSLVEALRVQLGLELNAIQTAEQSVLDTVYLNVIDGRPGTDDRVARALQATISILDRQSLLTNQAYVAALEKLVTEPDAQGTNDDQPPTTGPPLLITGNRLVGTREPFEPKRCPCFGASTVEGAVEEFLRAPTNEMSAVTAVLVVGETGSGKTWLCDRIQRDATTRTEGVTVIRPNVPLDFLGNIVGAAEDRIVAMFAACATRRGGKSVLIVDDVDVLLGSVADGNRTDAARWKQTFLACLDSLQETLSSDSAVLLVCASSDETVSSVHRFDRTYYLELPSDDARREFFVDILNISKQLGEGTDDESQRLHQGVKAVVESSAGRSYAEMMQLCRQALLLVGDPPPTDSSSSYLSALDVLFHLKKRLSSLTPASLRDGVLDSYVDLRIVASNELTADVSEGAFEIGERFPFRGKSAESAWNQLLATIVVPLCHAKELNDLLDCSGSGSRRVLAGGILLTGPPGSGKSTLALHCARYAALLSPSVKLLEVSCTSMIHKELGGSERAVHHLFEAARRASPCVVVLDGIENIAAVRGNDPTTEGTLDRVLSTLLVELDGVNDFSESGTFSIAVIGITSDERWIDAAVKRPGRLEKTVRLAIDWA